MKTLYAQTELKTHEARAAELAGTRMLIAEETTDALIALLIASGAVTTGEACICLMRLSERLEDHALGRRQSDWTVVPCELLDASARHAAHAAMLRARTGSGR